jgi:hypothetical protein
MHEGDPRGQLRPDKLGAAQCTQCHADLADAGAQRAHARHPAPGALPECTDCHMPRVVYGVLDVHPSHRIELPEPARDAATRRPDACTLCHVDQTRAWAIRQRDALWPRAAGAQARAPMVVEENAAWSEVETQLFAGDPVERALAAHALGRAPEGAEERQAALLLEVMQHDPYPAVRHMAWRSLRARLGEAEYDHDRERERSPHPLVRDYVPESPPSARARSLSAARARFTLSATDAEHASALRARALTLAIDIGE